MSLKHIIMAVILTAPVPASAQSLSQADLLSECTSMSNLAAIIMASRQKRVPLAKTLQAASQVSTQHAIPWNFLKGIVLLAYKLPVGTSEQAREHAIENFANDNMMVCMTEPSSSSP